MMHKKQFEQIAGVIRDAEHEYQAYEHHANDSFKAGAKTMREWIARNLARELRNQNARFDTARFLAACGVE